MYFNLQRLSYFKLLTKRLSSRFSRKAPVLSPWCTSVLLFRLYMYPKNMFSMVLLVHELNWRHSFQTQQLGLWHFSRKRSSPNNSLVVYFQVEALESLPQISQNVSSTPTIELLYVSVARLRKYYQHFTCSCFHGSSVYLSFKCEPHLNPSVFPKNDENVISLDHI